jgi:DNA-binding NarL/FixJ family response regulator
VIRVALADDAPEMRLLLRYALEDDGQFEVVGEATDGDEAMELLERETPDVIVLDMAMPKMDGLEVLAAMRKRGLTPKVLAFSGFDGGVEAEARNLGAQGYLRKGTAALDELIPSLLALFA